MKQKRYIAKTSLCCPLHASGGSCTTHGVFCTASQLILRLEVVVWWTRHRSPIAATLAYVYMLSVRDISAILDKAIID